MAKVLMVEPYYRNQSRVTVQTVPSYSPGNEAGVVNWTTYYRGLFINSTYIYCGIETRVPIFTGARIAITKRPNTSTGQWRCEHVYMIKYVLITSIKPPLKMSFVNSLIFQKLEFSRFLQRKLSHDSRFGSYPFLRRFLPTTHGRSFVRPISFT